MEVIKARILEFKEIKKGEVEYELEDGARIKIETSLEGVSNPLDDKNNPKCDHLGNKIYNLEVSSKVSIIPKERIKYLLRPREVKIPEVKG